MDPRILSYFPRSPWPHQYRGVEGVIERFKYFSDPVCLTAPTGTGKSAMQIALAQWGVAQDWPVIMLTNRKLLLEQTMGVLDAAHVPYGVRAASFPELMADHKMVQLSSIQTEIARVINTDRMQLFPAKLVLVDEAHLMKAAGAEEIIQRYVNDGAKVVGVTATPLNINHIYKHLVVACNTSEGRSCGALVKAIVYAPDEMDLSRIKPTKTGEYSVGDIRKEVWTHAIIARVYDKWKEYNPDAKPALLYAPGVAESVGFAEHFVSKGVRAAHIDGDDVWLDGKIYRSEGAIRKAVFDMWRAGDIKVICNRFVCLDDQTEVLTDAGWVGMNDISSDHQVANWDNGRVFFEQPKEIIRRQRQPSERMVVLESPSRSIRVTEDHELLYRTTRQGCFLKLPAKDLIDRAVLLPDDQYGMNDYRLQFEDGWKAEEVWCVSTSSGNIITRRKGTTTVMGNCREGLDFPTCYHIILATPIGSLCSYLQTVGRGLRKSDQTPDHVIIQDHGSSFWRHGSPNEDRDWQAMFEIPEKDVIAARLDKIRSKNEDTPEPISCPQCGMARATGLTCPGCGFTIDIKKKSRMVWQKSGELREVTHDRLPQRKTKITTDTQAKWDAVFWPSRKSKSPRAMTFKQVEAAFFRAHGYYPPRSLHNQPIHDTDWSRKVKDVSYQELRRPNNESQ